MGIVLKALVISLHSGIPLLGQVVGLSMHVGVIFVGVNFCERPSEIIFVIPIFMVTPECVRMCNGGLYG